MDRSHRLKADTQKATVAVQSLDWAAALTVIPDVLKVETCLKTILA